MDAAGPYILAGRPGVRAEENTCGFGSSTRCNRRRPPGVAARTHQYASSGGWGVRAATSRQKQGSGWKQSMRAAMPMGADLPAMPVGGNGIGPKVCGLGGAEGPDVLAAGPHPDRQGGRDRRTGRALRRFSDVRPGRRPCPTSVSGWRRIRAAAAARQVQVKAAGGIRRTPKAT